jgi:hypothetical protein
MVLCFNSAPAQSRGRVTAREREDIFRLIRQDGEFVKLLAEFAQSPDEVEEFVRLTERTMTVRKVDLNGDGRPDYIVEVSGGFCGTLANCPHWVYRKGRGGFERIGYDGRSRELTPQKTSTRGYRDLRAEAGSTASEDVIVDYKYDGREYRAADCFRRDHSGPRVKMKRIKCEESGSQ